MQEKSGIVDDLMIKAVGPMAGGTRVRSLCGALQAGVLTLGMLYGAEGEGLSSQEALVESFQPVKQFYNPGKVVSGLRRSFLRRQSRLRRDEIPLPAFAGTSFAGVIVGGKFISADVDWARL